MCGRYTLTSAPDAIRKMFGYPEQPNFPPRYNIAPTQPIAVVRMIDGKRQFTLMRWGLWPSWVRDPKKFSLIINARAEGVAEKPAFKNAIKRRRCLIPADGFYEWKLGAPPKQPYFIHAKSGEVLAFAGLWETWTGPNGEEVDTAAIITTGANDTLSPLHHRMPVIIPRHAFNTWLGKGEIESSVEAALAQVLIGPAPDKLLEAYPVSTEVNRVANDNPKLLEVFTGTLGSEETLSSRPRRAKASKPMKPKKNDGQGVLF